MGLVHAAALGPVIGPARFRVRGVDRGRGDGTPVAVDPARAARILAEYIGIALDANAVLRRGDATAPALAAPSGCTGLDVDGAVPGHEERGLLGFHIVIRFYRHDGASAPYILG